MSETRAAVAKRRSSAASLQPSALVDWNNNYADDEDKCVLFHCGNWAKTFLPDIKIATAPILGTIGLIRDRSQRRTEQTAHQELLRQRQQAEER